MIEWFSDNLWALWLAIAIILCIIEILMLDFVFLMMAVAALATAGSSVWVDSIVAQVVIFAAVSIALLLGLRPPLIKKFHQSSPDTPMNADGLVGQTALVIETVTSTAGLATLAGDTWTARPSSPEIVIPSGTNARVTAIKGATAYLTAL